MALKTGRAEAEAEVRIDSARCKGCGLCVRVCFGAPLYLKDGKAAVDQGRLFGCIGCGHCMVVCPQDSIEITGRDLRPEDVVPLPAPDDRADYARLHALMLGRRSVRHFKPRPVEREKIDRIIETASTAPMGVPPTDVGVLVLDDSGKIAMFRDDLLDAMRAMTSPWMKALMRVSMGREKYGFMKSFVFPAIDAYLDKKAEGKDWFFYNAPLFMFFYTAPIGDAVDPTIAATYAMLAGEALGLGSCMLGFPGPILGQSKELRIKYGLPDRISPGIALIFGYPDVRFRRALRRRFAEVRIDSQAT